MKLVIFDNNSITLDKMPMPPSCNMMYAGKSRRYASKELKQFKKDIQSYYYINYKQIEEGLRQVKSKFQEGIKIERVFTFKKSKVLCKNGEMKRLDVTNRIKAIDDSVLEIIGIDDKMIICGVETKTYLEKEAEWVKICITPMKMM